MGRWSTGLIGAGLVASIAAGRILSWGMSLVHRILQLIIAFWTKDKRDPELFVHVGPANGMYFSAHSVLHGNWPNPEPLELWYCNWMRRSILLKLEYKLLAYITKACNKPVSTVFTGLNAVLMALPSPNDSLSWGFDYSLCLVTVCWW